MLGLGLKLSESVAVTALPNGLLDGARAAVAEADLLVAGGESRRALGVGVGARVWSGTRGGEVGSKGFVEVGEGGLLGSGGNRGHDLADAVGRGLLLDLEDVSDGVLELGEGWMVLGRHR